MSNAYFPPNSVVKNKYDPKIMLRAGYPTDIPKGWQTIIPNGGAFPVHNYELATPEEASAFIEANPTQEELVARLIKVEKFIATWQDQHDKFMNGIMTVDEVRAREGLPPLDPNQ